MTFFSGLSASLRHAWRGLLLAFRTERSFRLLIAGGLIMVVLLILIPFERWERIVLLLAVASVLVLELVNSMVERLVDLVKPRLHGYVRDIKDLMAAAVLVAAIFTAVLAVMIFLPHLDFLLARV